MPEELHRESCGNCRFYTETPTERQKGLADHIEPKRPPQDKQGLCAVTDLWCRRTGFRCGGDEFEPKPTTPGAK